MKFLRANTIQKILDKLPDEFTFNDLHKELNKKRGLTEYSISGVKNYIYSFKHWDMIKEIDDRKYKKVKSED